tara:strand:- start:76 stop:522 length:447 start_codon:yes stop_codon:yes gene_type:complete
MRIYEVKQTKTGKTVGFARSFDLAKAIVKEDDLAARKVSNAGLNYLFSNGMVVCALEIKPDKEGIISKLNSLIEEKTKQPELDPEPVPQPVQEVSAPVSDRAADVGCPGIVPAIAYNGTGKGTCLHCKKEVGYVGGFPRVDPPAEICD